MDERSWLRALETGALPSGCGRFQGRWRWPVTPMVEGGVASLLIRLTPGARAFKLRVRLERLRTRMSQKLARQDPLGICRMLLLAETAGGSTPGMLRRLGFVHVLSASGIHLYALAGAASFVAERLARGLGLSVALGLMGSRALSVIVWIFAWTLCGCRPGMLRPLLLVGLRTTAESAGFRWRPYASLVAALSIDLAAGFARGQPPAQAIGYGLAVAGGTAGLQALRGGRGLRAHLALACGSWVFLALVEAWQESTLALLTPLLSLLTVPIYSLLAYPGLIAATLSEAAGFSSISEVFCAGCADVVTSSTVALSYLAMAAPSLWIIPRIPLLLACTFAGWVSATHPRTLLICVPLALGARLLISYPSAEIGVRELRQLSVGQGDAALVIDARGAGLIDTGSERAVSDSRWIGWFAHSGISRLDWVALTHLDEDHAGGLRTILRLLPVLCVESDRTQWRAPRGVDLERAVTLAAATPRTWGSGCVPYPTMAPEAERGKSESPNAAMGAVWIPLPRGASYLSAGDATARDEPRIGLWARKLSERWGEGGRILKISHHGSKTSSAPLFLSEFAPTELWISVGRGNLYGHPDPGVLARLEKFGVPVRRTDLEGELRP